MCAQLSLFGDDGPSPKRSKPAIASHPLRPWFDAIAELVGPLAVKQAGGRVAKIAAAMVAAGVAPEELRHLPEVIRVHAPYMTSLDLSAVQRCWVWLREPPRGVQPTPNQWRELSLNPDGTPPV